MEGVKIQIDKFDGSDFGFWKMQIEDFLYQRNLHEPLTGQKPDSMKQEDWVIKDRQALGIIRLSLAKNVAFNIVKETTTAGVMKALSDMYEKPSAANKVYLMRRLYNLRMSEGRSVADHINEFNMIISQLSSVEINTDDEIKALLLISSLPESWDVIVTAVSSSRGSEKLKFDEVRDIILSESIRRKEIGESSGNALSMEGRGRSKSKGDHRRRGKSKGRGKSQVRGDISCWNCGEKGHFRSNCPKPRNKKDQKKKTQDEDSVCSTEDLGDALVLNVESPIESWILDSGASFHSSPSREIFLNFRSGNFGKVYLADNKALEITGRGDVTIQTSEGGKWKLQDVRYIPNLKKNLISVGQLDSAGYKTVFGESSWKIVKGAMVIARGTKSGTLYTTSESRNVVAVTDSTSRSSLWHCRLGHMSQKGMQKLAQKGYLQDLKSVDLELCESCVLGKQKRVSFTKLSRDPKAERLELVHTDVWGPSPVSSLGGSKYYVTFIDDFSRKVWVYFLKHKSDVFSIFKRWKTEVETETGLKIKCLRSDNGGEYDSAEFKKFCAYKGIRCQRTVPGKARQNGIAERMNRTLNERARSMRLHSGLPKEFWADAVNITAYLINRGPSVPLKFKIPEEVWTEKEVKLTHLRTFGCTAYVHIDPKKRDKLDAKAQKCYFIGYGSDQFGYRFWDAEKKKVLRHCDVTFDENILYKDRSEAKAKVGWKLRGTELEIGKSSEDTEKVGADSGLRGNVTPEEDPEDTVPDSEHEDQLQIPEPVLRRSTRTVRSPDRYSPSLHYLLLTDEGEPESYEEAVQVRDSSKWEKAMDEEIWSLEKNHTWELTLENWGCVKPQLVF
jgi:transposase InsO family protein